MIPLAFTRPGRPLRFLATAMVGWVGVRTTMLLLPTTAATAPPLLPASTATSTIAAAPRDVAALPAPPPFRSGSALALRGSPTLPAAPQSHQQRAFLPGPIHGAHVAAIAVPRVREGPALGGGGTLALAAPLQIGTGVSVQTSGARWSGSVWSILRGGRSRGGTGGIATPQLGGSQAGARLAYALDDARRVALVGRVAAALGVVQQEAAIGVEWRLPAMPVRLVAEQRVGVRNIRSGIAIGAIGGVSAVPVIAGARLDAYGQAGVIWRDRAEGYADGSVRLARPVTRLGAATLDLGLGAWGAAQRGAQRLDAGPTMALALPIAGRGMRLTLDWRARIAGNARPSSGVALSLGADF